MGWIGRLVVIALVTTYACIWGVVIIPVMAGDTLICDDGVCPFKDIIFVVNIKRCRVPVWHRGMTGRTIRRNTYRQVIWVYAFIKRSCMTSNTLCRCAFKSVCMTIKAIDSGMRSCQWKRCAVMIKPKVSFSVRVAGQTCRAAVYIAIDTCMLFVGFRICMTRDAGECCPVTRHIMTIHTLGPFTFM